MEREVPSDALLQNVGDAAAVAIVVEGDEGADPLAVGVGVPVLVLIGVAQFPPCAPRQRWSVIVPAGPASGHTLLSGKVRACR